MGVSGILQRQHKKGFTAAGTVPESDRTSVFRACGALLPLVSERFSTAQSYETFPNFQTMDAVLGTAGKWNVENLDIWMKITTFAVRLYPKSIGRCTDGSFWPSYPTDASYL